MEVGDKEVDDFLAHYGVLGMKWGVRKDRNKANPNYDSQQRKRDRQIYGRGGERRINRKMNKGDRISVARGDEKTRRDKVMGRNKYVRVGGKVAGAAVGIVGANLAISGLKSVVTSRKGATFIASALTKIAPNQAKNLALGLGSAVRMLDTPQMRFIASTGAAAVGQMLSGDLAVSANMRLHGYDPNRK